MTLYVKVIVFYKQFHASSLSVIRCRDIRFQALRRYSKKEMVQLARL